MRTNFGLDRGQSAAVVRSLAQGSHGWRDACDGRSFGHSLGLLERIFAISLIQDRKPLRLFRW